MTRVSDDVFGALADPTRRALMEAISGEPGVTATRLAAEFPISRQAVVKHLAALADAGLVSRTRDGRDVQYRVTPEPLADAISWIAQVGGEWDERLQSLRLAFAPD